MIRPGLKAAGFAVAVAICRPTPGQARTTPTPTATTVTIAAAVSSRRRVVAKKLMGETLSGPGRPALGTPSSRRRGRLLLQPHGDREQDRARDGDGEVQAEHHDRERRDDHECRRHADPPVAHLRAVAGPRPDRLLEPAEQA